MYARDVMTMPVISVLGDTSVEEVARILLSRRISAVPVVDENDRMIGIVSEGDLMRRAEADEGAHESWWLKKLADSDSRAQSFARARGRLAKDVMSPSVIIADEDDSLVEIARMLEQHKIKRVPVVRHGKLVGIVSRANLLQGLATLTSPGPEPGVSSEQVSSSSSGRGRADDRTIRAAILNAIHNDIGVRYPINVIVSRGQVDLWGGVETESQRQAVRAAAESAPDVKSVQDHLSVPPTAISALLRRK
jgi:CBS domain-containing protein